MGGGRARAEDAHSGPASLLSVTPLVETFDGPFCTVTVSPELGSVLPSHIFDIDEIVKKC